MTDDTTGTETPKGHRYGVMDGNGGQWLVESTDEYPEPSPIGRVDDILRVAAPAAPTEARGPVARLRRKVAEVGELLNSPPPGTGAAWRKIAEAAAPETEGREVECPTCGWSTANPEWEQHACPGPRHSYDGTGWCSIHRSPDCVLTDASLPAAQPAAEGAPSEVAQYLIDRTLAETGELAEGAREDDGLDREELEHTIFGAMEALGIEDAAMSDARMIADAVEGLLSDWEGRRLAPGPRCWASGDGREGMSTEESHRLGGLDKPHARLLLRYHYPAGPYLPTGQLDGDCKQGCGAWPCEQADKALAAIGYHRVEADAPEVEGKRDDHGHLSWETCREDCRAHPNYRYEADAPRSAAINVRDFGAVGDGVHDDTAAVQAAFDSTAESATQDDGLATVDSLAAEIRRVDGSHNLGAGALAEALAPWLTEDRRRAQFEAWSGGWQARSGDGPHALQPSDFGLVNPYEGPR